MLEIVSTAEEHSGESSGEAAEQITEFDSGFAVRNVEGDRPYLNWQVGVMTTERRNYRGPGMVEPFQGTVSLFHIKGYVRTRDEALAMAKGIERNGG